MMHAETLEAIRRSAALPSMPLVATRCFEMTNDPLCSFDRLVELLSTDPGIAADVLRMANSPLFGMMREVRSLKHALSLLGLKRTRELVLTRYMVQRIEQSGSSLIDMTYYWRRSLTTAVVAAHLADTVLPKRRDEAFVAGLLADSGVLVLARALPSRYQPLAAQYAPFGGDGWIGQEQALLGVTHADVSAMVLEEWSLPGELVEAVRAHHLVCAAREAPDDAVGALASLVGAAGTVGRLLCEARDPADSAENCANALDAAGMDVGVLVNCFPMVERDVESLAALLRIDVIPDKIYKLIATHIQQQLLAAPN